MNDHTGKAQVVQSKPIVSCRPTSAAGLTSDPDSASRDEENPSPENQTQAQATPSSLVRKATGPRTPQGKQRSKYNALKHGIFSKAILLKNESRAEYNSLLTSLLDYFQPEGALEELLVEKLAMLLWRQRRLVVAECAEVGKNVEFLEWDEMGRQQLAAEKAQPLSLSSWPEA